MTRPVQPVPKRSLTRPRRGWIPYAVLGLSLLLTAVGVYYAKISAQAIDRAQFQDTCRRIINSIKARRENHLALLRGISGFFAAAGDGSIDRSRFHNFAHQLDLRHTYPTMQAIGYSRWIPPGYEAALVREMRRQGETDFHIWPAASTERQRTAIIYIEPHDSQNLRALGYDSYREPVRREAM